MRAAATTKEQAGADVHTWPVKRLMARAVHTIGPDATVTEAACELADNQIGAAVVVGSASEILGIFTERDLLVKVVGAGRDPASVTVAEVMTREPTTFDAELPLAAASKILNDRGFRHAPVVENGVLVGIVSLRDAFRVRLRQMEASLDAELRSLHNLQGLLELDTNERVHELVRINARLKELALTDELTGLYNYRYFMQRLPAELSRAQRKGEELLLIIADIDHFKRVNDEHGHPVGDEVLRGVADILRAAVEGSSVLVRIRKSDVVARYGGEEFAILLPMTGLRGAQVVGERLRRAIEERPMSLPSGQKIRVTISLGGAVFPDHAATGEQLLAAADKQMYRAKKLGRNCVCLAGEHDVD